jgi:hypothetical protein
MDEHERLAFDIALALREVRLYWQRGREPLTGDDKLRLARQIVAYLARCEITVSRAEGNPKGRGTGEYMR